MLAGYLAPTSGTAILAGFDIVESNLDVRRSIGYLPENNPLYEEMDVSEYLEWCAEIRGFHGGGRDRRIRAAVESCDLGDVLGKKIELLSKGFRQRVGLAAAILHDPQILLLDEPTSGLDPNQAREVRTLISRLKEEKTVLLSSHILPEVEASCDRIVILHKGQIAAQGSPSQLVGASEKKRRFRLSVSGDGASVESVRAAFEEVEGVIGVKARRQKDEIVADVDAEESETDMRAVLFETVLRRNWVLLELTPEKASLDVLFSELTLK
jgi:ABC-2 type transport system ATP-binding protein